MNEPVQAVAQTQAPAAPVRSLRSSGWLREAWTPNGSISARSYQLWAVITAVVILGGWLCLPEVLPSPLEVVQAFPKLADNGLIGDIYISLLTNVQGILISCAFMLPLAYVTVLPALRPLVQALCKLRFLGPVGIVVMFTLFFGGGHALKLALLVFGMGFFMLTSFNDIVEAIPKKEFNHARTLRMGAWGSVVEIVIVGHLAEVIDAIRQNAAMGWVMLTLCEGLVRFEGGLGASMLAQDKHLNLDAVFALQVIVIVVGVAQDMALAAIKRVCCPHAALTTVKR